MKNKEQEHLEELRNAASTVVRLWRLWETVNSVIKESEKIKPKSGEWDEKFKNLESEVNYYKNILKEESLKETINRAKNNVKRSLGLKDYTKSDYYDNKKL